MDMNMRIRYLVVCVRRWICGCGCENAIEYLHIRLFGCGIFYGVMPMQMHRGGRSGEEFYVRMSGFSCGYADAYAHLHP